MKSSKFKLFFSVFALYMLFVTSNAYADGVSVCSVESFESMAYDYGTWQFSETGSYSAFEEGYAAGYNIAVEQCHQFLEARQVECQLGYQPACSPLINVNMMY